MRQEIDALEHNKTWTPISLPPGKHALSSKWVFRIKHKADESIERYKACLVILGNTQTEGVDFTETFASIAKMVTIHTLLSIAQPEIGSSIIWTSTTSFSMVISQRKSTCVLLLGFRLLFLVKFVDCANPHTNFVRLLDTSSPNLLLLCISIVFPNPMLIIPFMYHHRDIFL